MKIIDRYDSFNQFYFSVYDVTRSIPWGRVSTYGAIANFLSLKGSAIFVGRALYAAQKLEDVPAHRVVNRNGLLSGKHHFSSLTKMQELLENEGIIIKDNIVVNFKDVFWDPKSPPEIETRR